MLRRSKSGVPGGYVFGQDLKWYSRLVPVFLHVELPFWHRGTLKQMAREALSPRFPTRLGKRGFVVQPIRLGL